ncbi:hypothetical protein E2C01_001426 [Portunus trituberculatus]|uniref:Uncharacterized protein n=1 Tax=Portunus trituberculatus TaxID=210409 RepID=A0A5B7CGM8_PORTR|nr:hypothetical protein [Portunus trituberculatus]
MPRGEELNRYQQEEHFRAPPPRENYRMDRFNPENYFETNHYVHGGGVVVKSVRLTEMPITHPLTKAMQQESPHVME